MVKLSESTTYIDIASSLMMYPIPKPSEATGPNPNRRRAGLPQLEVDKMLVLIRCQPGSVNKLGRAGALFEVFELASDGGEPGSVISRWRRQ